MWTGRCSTPTTRAGRAGRTPIAGAAETVARVRASGRRVLFFTNGTGRPPAAVRGRHPLARIRARRRGVHEPGRRGRALDRAPAPGEVGARARRAGRRRRRCATSGSRRSARDGAGGRRRRARRAGTTCSPTPRCGRPASRSGRARRCSRPRPRRSSRSTAAPRRAGRARSSPGIRQTTGARAVTLGKPSPDRAARDVPRARRQARPDARRRRRPRAGDRDGAQGRRALGARPDRRRDRGSRRTPPARAPPRRRARGCHEAA